MNNADQQHTQLHSATHCCVDLAFAPTGNDRTRAERAHNQLVSFKQQQRTLLSLCLLAYYSTFPHSNSGSCSSSSLVCVLCVMCGGQKRSQFSRIFLVVAFHWFIRSFVRLFVCLGQKRSTILSLSLFLANSFPSDLIISSSLIWLPHSKAQSAMLLRALVCSASLFALAAS